MDRPSLYDAIPSANRPVIAAHPGRMGALGWLHGLEPKSPRDCRVLELGCGEGTHLIALAANLPQSRFVGIDLAGESIAKGRKIVSDLGLQNVELHARDFSEVDSTFGEFDYIVAQGIYCWVPEAVRHGMLRIYAERLAPNGIGHLSFNVLPGCAGHGLARELLLTTVATETDPVARGQAARQVAKAWLENAAKNDRKGPVDATEALLRQELGRVLSVSDSLLLHDYLGGESQPFYLREVVERAEQAGLRYVSDAAYVDISVEPKISRIRQLALNDFTTGRRFRHALVCRAEQSVRESADPGALERLFIGSSASPVPAATAQSPEARFKTLDGTELTTNQPLAKAVLLALGRAWPKSLAFQELSARVASDVGRSASDMTTELARLLLALGPGHVVDFTTHQPSVADRVSDSPTANPLTRYVAEHGGAITNQHHIFIDLREPTMRRLLSLLDGTRSQAALHAELSRAPSAGATPSPEDVSRMLSQFLRYGLLVG